MRKLILWNMISLNGLFNGSKPWEIDWFVFEDELEKYILETQLQADTLLFGRVTYEGMAKYWPSVEGKIADFMNSIEKIVFSRTLDKADWANTRLVKDRAVEEVEKLKQRPGNDIFVFGSADFASTLIRHNLVDEYRFGINPVVLGKGAPFFKEAPDRLKLKLLMAKTLKSGLVLLHYQPAREQQAQG